MEEHGSIKKVVGLLETVVVFVLCCFLVVLSLREILQTSQEQTEEAREFHMKVYWWVSLSLSHVKTVYCFIMTQTTRNGATVNSVYLKSKYVCEWNSLLYLPRRNIESSQPKQWYICMIALGLVRVNACVKVYWFIIFCSAVQYKKRHTIFLYIYTYINIM